MMMYYYYEPACCDDSGPADDCKFLIKHSITGVSNDSYLVTEFEEKAVELLKVKGKTFTAIYQWSDGCAAQYKCKAAFARISTRIPPDMPVITRNYFETSHGKSVYDSLGAVVKNTAYQRVICGKQIISNADDLFKHCQENLKHGLKDVSRGNSRQKSQRDFVFVDTSEVRRETKDTLVKGIKGTRQLHSVRGTGSPNVIDIDKLSCNCCKCNNNEGENCTSQEYVRPWQRIQLQPVESPACPSSTEESTEPQECATGASVDHRDPVIDDYVAVYLEVRERRNVKKQLFIAQVLDVDPEQQLLYLNFMQSSVQLPALYEWPSKDDKSWEASAHVLIILDDPEYDTQMSTNRHQLYNFTT